MLPCFFRSSPRPPILILPRSASWGVNPLIAIKDFLLTLGKKSYLPSINQAPMKIEAQPPISKKKRAAAFSRSRQVPPRRGQRFIRGSPHIDMGMTMLK